MKNILAFRIIPELSKVELRYGISGSLIKFNQKSEKKNAIENPNKIKILKIHKHEKALFSLVSLVKLLLNRIAAAGVAGSQ